LPVPVFTPPELTPLRSAFDRDDFIFELKMDGFRALAYIESTGTRLVSRRGNTYKRFAELATAIHAELGQHEAVLDGEIVCVDASGRPQFYNLLFRRGSPVFYVFDLPWLDGEDLRLRPLLYRKRILRKLISQESATLLYAREVEGNGKAFYSLACDQDLEGIVAKLKHGAYGEGWFKIRNREYSQYEGRQEFFEKQIYFPDRAN
jgi:bifunctional non-homologous end joining protein LigD